MNGKQVAFIALAVVGVAAGFAFGFAWGRGTRDELPGATETEFSGGVLTVRLDAYKAAGGGLASLLR